MNRLMGLLENFLVQESLQREEFTFKLQLVRIYRQYNLPKHLRLALEQLRKIHEKYPGKNAEFHQHAYELTYESYLYQHDLGRAALQHPQEVSNNLDLSYLCRKLRQTCYMVSRKAVFNKDYDFGMLPVAIRYIEQQDLLRVPAIAIYYYIYKSFQEGADEQYFTELRGLINRYAALFPPREIYDIYLLAINYCIRKLNEGNEAYLHLGLDLYKEGLKEKHLLPEDRLSRTTYSNIVGMGLKARDFAWVHSFIQKYKNKLVRQYRASTYAFCLARYEYEQQHYDEVILLIHSMKYPDTLIGLVAKTLLLKVYYETEEFELLQAHLDAMDVFLRRKKVIGYHKRNYQAIIRLTRKLIKVNHYNRQAVRNLAREIRATEGITERAWLLRQVDSFMR